MNEKFWRLKQNLHQRAMAFEREVKPLLQLSSTQFGLGFVEKRKNAETFFAVAAFVDRRVIIASENLEVI